MMATLEQERTPRVDAPILVVDDEPDLREVVVLMLESEGYTTTSARDGVEALACIEGHRPALVLLDMRMPRMDGWAFARSLAERGIDVPLIVMTAARDARRWAAEIDADAWLGKPFRLDTLVKTVERVLRGKG